MNLLSLKKNELLLEKNNELFNMLEKFSGDDVEILEAKDKNKTAKLNGKMIHSLYRPIEEAIKNIEKLEIEKKNLILVLGAGIGYSVVEVLKKIANGTKIFIVENKLSLISTLLENTTIAEALKNDILSIYHTTQDKNFMYDVEKKFQLGLAPDYEIIINNVCYENSEKEYLNFLNIFRDLISNNLVGTSTIFEFSKMWHKNSFENLRHFAASIGVKELEGKFKNIPVIVVAAGPSLDKNIKYLKWVKNKAVTIVVGTALKKVLSEGIEPDFIMGIDGGEPNWEHFRRAEYAEYPFVYEPMVNPKILDYHKGTEIVFVSQNIVGLWGEYILGEKGFAKMGGSVAISAYDFGVRLGGNPVVLLGQDLAFSGGKSHVSGSVYEKDTFQKDDKDIHQLELEDIYGGKVFSDRKLYTFLQYFERFIASDLELYNELEVIDATEGGAKIQGTKVMTLKNVYHKYISNQAVDVKSILKSLEDNIDGEKNIAKLIEGKNDIMNKLKETLKHTEDGIKILSQIVNKNDYSRVEQLDNVDKKLKKYPEVDNLIKFITQPIISKIFRKAKEKSTEKDVYMLNLELYNGIKEGIEFNIKCLERL